MKDFLPLFIEDLTELNYDKTDDENKVDEDIDSESEFENIIYFPIFMFSDHSEY